MRKLVFALALLFAGEASAQSTECGFIRDPDARNDCIARSTHSSNACGLIQNSDAREACRGRTGNRNNCGLIHDPDQRARCQAGL